MVVERSDVKRRRRDAQDPLEGSPKRTKVHAQRKFAQGSGVLTTGAVTMTPIKEKPSMMGTIGGVKVNGVGVPAQSEPAGVEQIGGTSLLLSASSSHQLSVEPQSSSAQTPSPANRPNTEDFLTFLCFRGTNVLPPRLNMFNTAYRSDEQEQQESTSVSQNTSKQLSSKLPNQDNSQKPKRNSGQSSSSGAGGGGTGLFSGPKQKIKQQGLATVQALKDKYRRQRLSQRQKVSLTKLAMKVKGKNMIRTRSAVLLEERKKKKKYSAPSSATASTQQQRHHTTRVRPRSHQVILKRLGVNKARAGLRSGGVLPPSADNRPKKERKLRRDNSSVESPKNPQKSTSKGSTSSVKLKKAANLQFRDSSASEASPADSDEPSAKKMRPMRTRRPPPSVLRPTSLLPSVKKRPSRKTKEAAAIYMEMLTKDLRSPDEEEEEEEEEEEIGETLEEVKRKMRDDEGSRSRFRGNESFENSNLEQGGERESKMKSVKLPKRKTSSASTTSTSTPARTKDSSVSTKKTVKGREKLSDAQDGLKAEIKTRSSAIKAAQNSAKMSAAGRKSFEENKKPDKSLTETTTRTTRKSGAKAKEVSLSPPPRRVLRAKTNRISLAEDCSSEEEEEDEEEEEEEREEEDEDQGEKVEETMMCKPPRLERNRAASKSSSPLKTRRSLRGRVEMSEPAQEVHTVKSGQKSSRKSNETGGEKEKPVKKTNSKSAEVKRSKKEGKKVTEDEDEMSSKKSSRPSRSAHKSEPVKSEEELVEEESSKVLTRRHMRQMSSENMDCLPHPLPLTSFQKAVQEQKKRPLTGKKKPVEERATEEPQVTSESEVEKSEALTHTNNNNNEENEKTPEEEVQDAKKVAKNTEVMEVKVEGEKEDISEVDLETETPPGKAKTCDLGTPESPFQELMGYKEGALVLPKEEQLSVDVCEKKLDMKPSLEAMVQQPAIMKPSIGDTWREAFKNAKLPKPGQLSPIPHGVRPFERKPFSKSPLLKELGGESSSSPKLTLPTVFPVKRLLTKEVVEGPMEEKKVVTKSLTQLQYEKRTSELVSGLVLPSDSWNQPEVKKPPSASTPTVKPAEGKHLNLPLPVEHTLRKHSPTTVTRKPLPARVFQPPPPQSLPQPLAPPPQEQVNKKDDQDNKPSAIVDLNLKKKVNMTTEEIKGWLSDSTSSGIKHAKNCEIFKNNRCECSYRTRTSGEGGSSNPISSGEEGSTPQVLSAPPIVPPIAAPPATLPPEVDKSVVQPPIQLKELDPKFCTETISTCKVEEYKEILSKKGIFSGQPKKPVPKRSSKGDDESPPENPRDSESELSSLTPSHDGSPQQDKTACSPASSTYQESRKPIFHQKRNMKRPPLSKSPLAFSPENESSVYAFVPDMPHKAERPSSFRRNGVGPGVTSIDSKGKQGTASSVLTTTATSTPETMTTTSLITSVTNTSTTTVANCPSSSSIAVQVNLETEAVLECSTQTEREGDDGEGGGHLFYIPLPEGPLVNSQLAAAPQQLIQGVAVKLDTEGPDQRVIMRAKLITKPPTTFGSTPRSLVAGGKVKPEQKVRPLGSAALTTEPNATSIAPTVTSSGTVSAVKPPPVVGTVQPTVRRSSSATVDQSTGTAVKQTTQATQADSLPAKPVRRESVHLPPPLPPPLSVKPTKSRQVGLESGLNRGKSISPSNTLVAVGSAHFPKCGTPPCLVEAPTFRPTEKEFHDPLEYIDRITPLAQQFGICRIIPPPNFKPECKVSDDMRFTAYNQYIHKMLNRWGPNVKEMSAIRKYLATQSIALNQPPLIGGMEVDLPRLYQTVQQCGGLKEVIEKKRWTRVADAMKIPKSAQDRVTKLDDIYCKFLLPYDTLSHEERNKLLKEVEDEWRERERRESTTATSVDDSMTDGSEEDDRDDRDECVTKGKSMPLSAFFRIARNTMAMWFKPDATPSAADVEAEFWRHVSTGQSHVCVHSASIESATWGYGFPTTKSSSTSRHPWNLKVLTNNPGSILRSIGPLMGVTVPTLHVGMLFSTCCWYRDPHALPWIEYLHTGATKVWYGVPDEWSDELRGALKGLLPRYVRDKAVWLASDIAMVPPALLVERGVALCRTVQEPGQFVLVFPKAFTSSICTGYVVSESVYFARPMWLDTAEKVFKDIQESCEPTVFSLEKLLFCIANDSRSSVDVLNQVLPMVVNIRETEVRMRRELEEVGLVATERLPGVTKGRQSSKQNNQHDYDCDTCRGTLFLSLVTNSHEEVNYCLTHAVEMLKKDPSQLKHCKLLYGYDEEEMEELIEKVKSRIEMKSQKKGGQGGGAGRSSGGASAANTTKNN